MIYTNIFLKNLLNRYSKEHNHATVRYLQTVEPLSWSNFPDFIKYIFLSRKNNFVPTSDTRFSPVFSGLLLSNECFVTISLNGMKYYNDEMKASNKHLTLFGKQMESYCFMNRIFPHEFRLARGQGQGKQRPKIYTKNNA